ncbi:unnamed protein product [Periconia digitata]|uniref:Uncharacterized protein n=1 Tax=Periconia digitata TaxID=1303443 RepID=A0A9W4U8B0_9PLEO|nr:unnamed protein product [Periconia digitata]
MSVTTTANPQTYNLRTVLADYELHHTPESEPLDTSLNAHPEPSTTSSSPSNPPHWPTDARRVPNYRPLNRNLVQSERRVYQNGVEQAFVGVMFTGVVIEAVNSVKSVACNTGQGLGHRIWERRGVVNKWDETMVRGFRSEGAGTTRDCHVQCNMLWSELYIW